MSNTPTLISCKLFEEFNLLLYCVRPVSYIPQASLPTGADKASTSHASVSIPLFSNNETLQSFATFSTALSCFKALYPDCVSLAFE